MSANGPAATPPRVRFYRRRRFWAWSGAGVVGLGLVLLLAVYWLLQTVAGRDVLLAQVVARLPVGASFTWDKVDGPVAGPLTLYNVDFRYDDIHFHAERAHLEPDLRPLLGRKLMLDKLELTNATLNLAKSDEPFTLPSWPDSLPQIEMPLAIQADAIAIDGFRITSGGEPLIDIARARGGVEIANGEFKATQLVADTDMGDFRVDGKYLPRNDYETDVTATAVLPPPRGRTAATVGLVARGNLGHMEVAVAGRAPKPLRALLVFDGRTDPTWSASVKSDALELALLGPALAGTTIAPLSLDLRAEGKGGHATLQGRAEQGEYVVELAPSRVSLEDQVLNVDPLVVKALGGDVRLQGSADLRDADNQKINFSVVANHLTWTPAPDPNTSSAPPVPVTLKEARLGLAGTLKAWAAIGRADVEREKQKAQLRFDVRGNDQAASIRELQADTPGGQLQVEGQVAWAPQLVWDAKAKLQDFDPGYFAPGWDGRLSGSLASTGRQQPPPANAAAGSSGDIQATVDLPSLKGSLRKRALDAQGRFALQGSQGEGQLKLALGNSHVTASGKVGDRLDIDARFEPLQLSDLLPGADGGLRGQVQVKGPRDAPDITADLVGDHLSWDGYGAEAISIKGRLPWRGDSGTLAVQGQQVNAGMLLERLNVDAQGSVSNLRLAAQARNEMGAVDLQGSVHQQGAQWRGELATLRIAPVKGDAWALRAPASFAINGGAFTLTDTCLAPGTGGALCAQANWPREGLTVRGDALPLSLVQPWLPPQSGRRIYLRGELNLDAQIRPRGNAWEGKVDIRSPEGGVRLGTSTRSDTDAQRGELVRYDQFSIKLDMTPAAINGYLGMGFQGNGFVDAKVKTGWEAGAPLNGELYLNMARLYWLELFSPDIVRPTGLIEGHVSLRGTRGQPSLGGEANLSNFKTELPALGLTLDQGKGSFVAQPDGSAKIVAQANSGKGTLHVDGGLSWFGDAQPLQLKIHGENVLVSNTSELRIIANPDLDFTLAKAAMELRGTVHVPEADIDLERLDRGTSVSEDVVVLDPADPEESRTSPLDMDLAVSLGDKVKMAGFGLKGALTGKMQVWAKPGREMTANGGLEVSGRYKAYGQDLTITRGNLNWNYNVVSDPRINIRAERRIGDVTAGIDVTGRAQQPRADVWSDPAMSQSEALAYLVLGRSLTNASTDQTQQVTAASAALSAGSGLLASQLGAKLGLDDAGVSQSRALGGSVIGFGKYISPKLYVGYGVSMVGAGSVLTLKYLLRRGFDLEVESSTVENRGSLNWRREK
ncbi:translocation/assembly module TamB domain-containing protein [Stenotrophomonas sp. 24(2023)]|uniref:translocation/assembly module TamB domain-containing protein n=1 Tax=Stenotrophomonas sp. 24(2023) TaxID=3068324 RepID=UPI0027DEC9B9|nr:translocation/assembly module TamB domain-containing protein [Stenotrophomonas sp. 24(2023)]WMJ71012.1 translocation/assembly module TamB domain-containing protein [Stenotrophomonas sp. 24(2023)]